MVRPFKQQRGADGDNTLQMHPRPRLVLQIKADDSSDLVVRKKWLRLFEQLYPNTKGLPTFWLRHQVPRLAFGSQSATIKRRSLMNEITRVGVDLAKHVIQVHSAP